VIFVACVFPSNSLKVESMDFIGWYFYVSSVSLLTLWFSILEVSKNEGVASTKPLVELKSLFVC